MRDINTLRKIADFKNPLPGLQSIILTWIRVTFQILYKIVEICLYI